MVTILAVGIYFGAQALLATGGSKTPVEVNDIIKTTVTAFTLIGAVLTGVYAYRKQLLTEGDAQREDARHLAERYSTAAEQLGHEQAAVRLAGVYAMARLADDWPDQRQVCIDVLCAYIRMPYEPGPDQSGFKHGEREVRLTILRVIRDHLQNPDAPLSWCGLDFDFNGALFDGGDFSGAHFNSSEVNFNSVKFIAGTFHFDSVQFNGGKVHFGSAELSGGKVHFNEAKFNGGKVHFTEARFCDAVVDFNRANFNDSEVNFRRAEYNDSEVRFDMAEFNGGEIDFTEARFCDAVVDFSEVQFNDAATHFNEAMFNGGEVQFYLAKFNSGTTRFATAQFNDSEVRFNLAEFNGGEVHFDRAEFNGGNIRFTEAECPADGSAVSFDNVVVTAGTEVEWGPFPTVTPNAENTWRMH